MVGITATGAYVPLFRLGKDTAGWKAPGERPVANFDEDSLTMGVAAVLDCLNGRDRTLIGGLHFATTTSPYAEKQSASLIAIACDLPQDMMAVDYAHSLRSGTVALKTALDSIKAGSARQAIVVTADTRQGAPRSNMELNSGDGAVALLVGDKDVVAQLVDSRSLTHEILDVWRVSGEAYTHTWEDRFATEEGYAKFVSLAVAELLKKNNLTVKDIAKLILSAPDPRKHRDTARALGFTPEQVQDPLFGSLGNTGCANATMLLAAALESAKPGDKLLVVNYGDGADAMLFEVTPQVEKMKQGRGLKGYLASKKLLPSYETYLSWRGIYEPDTGVRRPPQPGPSASALHREQAEVLRLQGSKCRNCGTVQYPPQRVCTRCHTKDQMDPVRLAEKKASLYTYSMDYIAGSKDVPLVISVINFDGGGRMLCSMTDRDINEVKVGMPLELSFRRLYTADGIHNYFWKAVPVRS
ncbi:MAG: OB-fold domain-containing protein [Dehalococcoidia bacterium]